MRFYVQCATLLLALAAFAVAGTQTPDTLKAKADAAHGAEQAKLCLEYARVQLEHSNALFTEGDVDKAQQQIQEVIAKRMSAL